MNLLIMNRISSRLNVKPLSTSQNVQMAIHIIRKSEMLFMKTLPRIVISTLVFFTLILSVQVLGYSAFQVSENATTPQTVTFALISTPPSGSSVTSIHYDFGDGTSSSKESPVHVYAKPGKYSPSLTIVWSDSVGNIYTTKTTMTLVIGNVIVPPSLSPIKTIAPTLIVTPGLVAMPHYVATPYRTFSSLPTNLTPLTRSYPAVTFPEMNYETPNLNLTSNGIL